MKHLLIAVSLLFTSVAFAEGPPLLPDNVVHIKSGPCTDVDTNEHGACALFADTDGNYWLLFAQAGEISFVRWMPKGGGYENVWEKPGWNAH